MFNRARVLSTKKIVLIAYDFASAMLAILLAMLIRFDFSIPAHYLELLVGSWYFFPVIALMIYYLLGCYDQMWVFAGVPQFLLLPAATFVQTVVTWTVMHFLHVRFPYSTYIIYIFLMSSFTVMFRALYKWYSMRQQGLFNKKKDQGRKRVLIVGAGKAGSQLIAELQTLQVERVPVAIVDDNPYTQTFKSRGVPVLGNRNDIPALVKRLKIDEIIIAVPSAQKAEIGKIVEICQRTKAETKIIPGLPEILTSDARLSQLREVQIEDLLGRKPVELDVTAIANTLKGKVVLITGGGGSIGSEMARQISKFRPGQLILFDMYENNVYELQQELKTAYGEELNLEVLIGSVRDKERLNEIFETYHPDCVFHAAAHKHVPLMQDSPRDAVKNNIFGTWNVANCAGEFGAESFTLISTDKAVNPTNVMGATKRFAEMVVLACSNKYPHTKFAAVRFGNVLGSSGSVIPLFRKQIKEQRRITVTHPDIVRFFMTIPEAARLVLQAGALAKGGEVFVLDMGEPVKILDLAISMIKLSGLEPHKDVPIDFIGLRPGEKMYEELSLDQEHIDATAHDKIFTVGQITQRDLLAKEMKRLSRLIGCDSEEFTNLRKTLLEQIAQGSTE